MSFMIDAHHASDINVIARFLAHQQVQNISSSPSVDCIVICVSAVFHGAENLFRALQSRPDLTKTLVLCGGLGHSTPLIYDAVARNSTFNPLAKEIQGLPEARVLEKIMERYFDVSAMTSAGCKILIEDTSTNCGANAIETRKVIEKSGAPPPKTFIIIQDPTMSLRTAASFEKAYDELESSPSFLSYPSFIPEVQSSDEGAKYTVENVPATDLWEMERFLNLVMGEIPRLRDDEAGYGPKGTNSIQHVDIPVEVEEAWWRLQGVLQNRR